MQDRPWLRAIIGAVLTSLLAALAIRFGLPPPPPVVIPPPASPEPSPPPAPPAPQPDTLAAIARMSNGRVGCSCTFIGLARPDGRRWILSAAHCIERTGERWTIRLRDGRTTGAVVVNFNRRADYAWLVSDADGGQWPYALLAPESPAIGTRIWHAGYGTDQPGNREDGEIASRPNPDGQIQMSLSVSSGDSGGGIAIDSTGRIVSCVCCTSARGKRADVWGASVEAIRAGQVETVELWEWVPLEIPLRDKSK